MMDLGFGFVDRYTVLAIVFTMVAAQGGLGLRIPVDATNAGNLVGDVVVLTGFFFLIRTVGRIAVLFLMMIYSAMGSIANLLYPPDYSHLFGNRAPPKTPPSRQKNDPGVIHDGSQKQNRAHHPPFTTRLRQAVDSIPIVLYGFFATTAFGDIFKYRSIRTSWYAHFLRVERFWLIGMALVATIPFYRQIIAIAGIAGIVILTLIYILNGTFTWLIRDALNPEEDNTPKPLE